MGDPDEMDCDALAEVAAELALGVLTGRDRARALAHLDRCEACRDRVRPLTVTGEKLLELVPCHEPPSGFETRVLARLGAGGPVGPPARPRRPPRPSHAPRSRWLLTVAAAVAVGCGLAGWQLGAVAGSSASSGGVARSQVRTASLVTADHRHVGTVFLHGGDSRWVYMTVDTDAGDGAVTCQVVGARGGVVTVGAFRLRGGYGYWGGPEPLRAATVTGVRLESPGGAVVATARFGGGR